MQFAGWRALKPSTSEKQTLAGATTDVVRRRIDLLLIPLFHWRALCATGIQLDIHSVVWSAKIVPQACLSRRRLLRGQRAKRKQVTVTTDCREAVKCSYKKNLDLVSRLDGTERRLHRIC